MPITLPVPGGGGATTPSTYYNSTNLGEYQFISLQEIIDNFTAAYVGEGKILQNVLSADVSFHAHRALQELHYDTLKSCKSQEIEVCSSLKMPLPHDYVNYVKLTWVDSAGIEHIIYPTRDTSNPFAISQGDNCSYEYNEDGTLKHQQTCVAGETQTCNGTLINEWWMHYVLEVQQQSRPVDCSMSDQYPIIVWNNTVFTFDGVDYTFNSQEDYEAQFHAALADYCQCMNTVVDENGQGPNFSCGDYVGLNSDNVNTWLGYDQAQGQLELNLQAAETLCPNDFYVNLSSGVTANLQNYSGTGTLTCTPSSNAWTSFSTAGNVSAGVDASYTSNTATDTDMYMTNFGKRYGIEPQYAQANGAFFMDCINGYIHFSANLVGKTIILKYISDGHGTKDEAIVPKLAEEAMYKWIAYGCISARADAPEYLVARLKKERFAETRKAKIRLSNIKIEEISQVFRGKSKWIKH